MVSSSGVVLLIEAAIGVPDGKPQDLINGSSPVLMAYSDGSSERWEGLLGGRGCLCPCCGPQGPSARRAWCPTERELANREFGDQGELANAYPI